MMNIKKAVLAKILKVVAYCAVGAALCWLSYSVGKNGIVRAAAQQNVKVRPFVAERWLTAYAENPAGEVIKKRLMERRSDGAIGMKVLAVLTGPGETPTRQLMLPDGQVIYINDQQHIRSSFHKTKLELAHWKKQLAKNAEAVTTGCGEPLEVAMGTREIANHQVEIWQRESPAADHTAIRMSFYRAPDLGCADLGQKLEHKNADGSYTLKWEELTRTFTEVEPPVADMDPGAGFAEVTPSEFSRQSTRVSALMDEAVKSGWCNTHDCTAVTKHTTRMREIDRIYRSRQ